MALVILERLGTISSMQSESNRLHTIETSEALNKAFHDQKAYFRAGHTLPVSERIALLKKLQKSVKMHRDEMLDALWKDLHRPRTETYGSEIVPVESEIAHAIQYLNAWTKNERLPRDILSFWGTSYVSSHPRGVCLIITPYNFPFSISLTLLVGALAAGNCVLLKPSEKASHSLRVLTKIVTETFTTDQVAIVTGGTPIAKEALALPVNYIYFIGSKKVGKIVMEAAAKNITPLSLGLSGKSPAIVDGTGSLNTIAQRIAWAKFFNNGQACTAIDYLLVKEDVRDTLIEKIAQHIQSFYGTDAKASESYGRLIDTQQFDNVIAFIKDGTVYHGGASDREDCYIEPTIMIDIPEDAPARHKEIFGPILPVFTYTDAREVTDIVNKNPDPLAVYIYSTDTDFQKDIVEHIDSGGISINDALVHNTSPLTPNGGVHHSGFGRLHGKFSFDTFSYKRTFLKRTLLFDLPGRFPPYNDAFLPIIKRIFR